MRRSRGVKKKIFIFIRQCIARRLVHCPLKIDLLFLLHVLFRMQRICVLKIITLYNTRTDVGAILVRTTGARRISPDGTNAKNGDLEFAPSLGKRLFFFPRRQNATRYYYCKHHAKVDELKSIKKDNTVRCNNIA